MRRFTARTIARLAVLSCLALVATAAWSQAVGTPYSYSRTSSFTYQSNGLLASETVEPDLAQQCVTTSYTYDAYGNKTGSSTANCAGASGLALFDTRASSSTYAAQTVSVGSTSVAIPAGTFATSAKVALTANIADAASHAEAREYDPRFGVVTKLTGPNSLDTSWQFDALGRKVLEMRADGTRTAMLYCLISGRFNPAGGTGSNTAGCPSPAANEIPALAVRFEHTEPRNSSNTKIGAFSRAYYDRAGRRLRTVTEAFDGPDQPAAAGSLIVQDSHYDAHGAVVVATAAYFLATGSTNTGGSSDMGLTRTDYDALGRPKDLYAADPATTQQTGGSQASVAFGVHGSHRAAKTSIAYNGLNTTTTDDKGQTRVEEKNPLGLVVRVTDAMGAQIVHQHDAFGNLVKTKDPLANVITVKYDVRGRKVRLEDPDAGASDYCHDALGQIKAQRNSKMRGSHATTACPSVSGACTTAPTVTGWTTLAYDRMGRLTSRAEPEYTSTWHYDRYADGSACHKGIGKLCQSSTSHGVSRKHVYDSLGRPSSTRTDISGGPSMASHIAYGTSGSNTGKPVSQTWPTGVRVSYVYTDRGYLLEVKNDTALTGSAPLTTGNKLWRADIVNARGQAERQTYFNGVHNRAVYEPRSGRLTHLTAGTGTSNAVVHQRLHWDSINRLTARVDGVGDGSSGIEIQDSHTYDALGRMTRYVVSGNGTPNVRTVDLQYNALGMLLFKSDVGIYTYPTQGTSHGRPHAVQSISGAHAGSYGYDLNGNATSASGGQWRSVSYTSFNLPDANNGLQGPGATPKYVWQYDENHQRIRETRTSAAGTRTTWNLHPDNQGGLGFEREVPPSGSAQNRHYVSAGGQAIGVIVTEGNLPTLDAGQTAPVFVGSIAAVKLQFWHKDHLGSTIATTNHTGAVTGRYSYDPFGKRRNVTGTYDPFGNIVIDWTAGTGAGTDRGYTGHEHLDDVGVIHMNGRVFDPVIARFMQADPIVQAPGNLQNYDRFGYCFNNPTICTDPSGYSFFTSLRNLHPAYILRPGGTVDLALAKGVYSTIRNAPGQRSIDNYVLSHPWLYALGVAAAGYWGGPFASAAVQGYAIYASGGTIEQAQKTAMRSVATAAAFYAVGSAADAYNWGDVARVAAHAAVGCATAEASGGTCKSGAMSAGFSEIATVNNWQAQGAYGVVSAAAIGGVSSVLGGGKFANGAITAAYGYLFNQLAHASQASGNEPIPVTEQERILSRNSTFALTSGDIGGAELFRIGFWEDRYLRGDPLAANGLGVVLNNKWQGQLTNFLAGTQGARGTRVGVDIISTYVRYLDQDFANTSLGNWRGVLSDDQITAFHREVFARQGIPMSRYLPGWIPGVTACKPKCDPYSP
jgi:RHS repeat-associated protein